MHSSLVSRRPAGMSGAGRGAAAGQERTRRRVTRAATEHDRFQAGDRAPRAIASATTESPAQAGELTIGIVAEDSPASSTSGQRDVAIAVVSSLTGERAKRSSGAAAPHATGSVPTGVTAAHVSACSSLPLLSHSGNAAAPATAAMAHGDGRHRVWPEAGAVRAWPATYGDSRFTTTAPRASGRSISARAR